VSASASPASQQANEDGPLDSVRALQRTLYRSAKQDGKRRFHALERLGGWIDLPGRGEQPKDFASILTAWP
jgi:hypothetical protein